MSRFHITTHVLAASHLREFSRGTISAANPPQLKLAVNQYAPRSNAGIPAQSGDVTIIFCHANGIQKELYEPFFDHLLVEYEKSGLRIRSIWALDAVHQGASGVLNEEVLGDDPCWNDLCRDVLHMVNQRPQDFPPPIIGMGHSYGGHAIARISFIHPSLFTSILLLDPIIEDNSVFPTPHPSTRSAKRQDVWPSMAEAEKYVRSRPFYTVWDPRVLEIYLKVGFRPLPTLTYPNKTGVTLTTTKHQEVYTYIRHDKSFQNGAQLGRDEPGGTLRLMSLVTPPLMYLVGEKSDSWAPHLMKYKMQLTPGATLEIVGKGYHLFPLELPAKSAELAAPFLIKSIKRWGKEAEKDLATPRHKVLTVDFHERLSKL
ncbi:Alpha/beta hydrolase family-domain-containing protein [Tuber borchii]|uniref:Alpha/beta hydrolase family-domain-containing protein n=1 Tax=Tuber borchii TaxID=42251 RepID=A0A2T6ZZX6_TUBBO|nr:Alpha/beta hydrolase family-domain-containing protein [Tuber borchii]